MPTYTPSPASAAWRTAPTPTADAWLQPIGGEIFVTEDAVPVEAKCGIVPDRIPYPVTTGKTVKYRSVNGDSVSIRMWDKT